LASLFGLGPLSCLAEASCGCLLFFFLRLAYVFMFLRVFRDFSPPPFLRDGKSPSPYFVACLFLFRFLLPPVPLPVSSYATLRFTPQRPFFFFFCVFLFSPHPFFADWFLVVFCFFFFGLSPPFSSTETAPAACLTSYLLGLTPIWSLCSPSRSPKIFDTSGFFWENWRAVAPPPFAHPAVSTWSKIPPPPPPSFTHQHLPYTRSIVHLPLFLLTPVSLPRTP